MLKKPTATWTSAHPFGSVLTRPGARLGSVWPKGKLWFAEAGGLQSGPYPSSAAARLWVEKTALGGPL